MAPLPQTDSQKLLSATAALLALLIHGRNTLNAPNPSTESADFAPLDLLHDLALLIKAHTTKISLALRPPITFDAATKCVQELSKSVLAPLLAGMEQISAARNGKALHEAMVHAVDDVLKALEEYAKDIPNLVEERDAKRLPNTGVVWEAADRLADLKVKGLTGIVAERLKGHGELLKDAMGELKEWLEEEEDDDDGERGEEDEDAFWDTPTKKMPKDDVEMRKEVEIALKKIKLVTILFAAVGKRRLGDGPGKLKDVERLDRILEVGAAITSIGDDLAGAWYELDGLEGEKKQKEFEEKTVELCELAKLSDDGKEDSFTKWFGDWILAIKKSS
ncbi:hypothetical protein RUND412_000264 [Rhizina undulata]